MCVWILGRIFSIIGIIEAFAKFVFVSTYSLIYKSTLETWPSAFYVCSFLCLVVTAMLFGLDIIFEYNSIKYIFIIFRSLPRYRILYFIVKQKTRRDAKTAEEEAEANEVPTATNTTTVENKTNPIPGENSHI